MLCIKNNIYLIQILLNIVYIHLKNYGFVIL